MWVVGLISSLLVADDPENPPRSGASGHPPHLIHKWKSKITQKKVLLMKNTMVDCTSIHGNTEITTAGFFFSYSYSEVNQYVLKKKHVPDALCTD